MTTAASAAATTDGLRDDAYLTGLLGVPSLMLVVTDASAPDALSEQVARIPEGPSFVTAKVPTGRVDLLETLLSQGFTVVDTNLTLRRAPSPSAPAGPVRPAAPADANAVTAVARGAFSVTRFHLDPHVDDLIADQIKATWAGNFFSGQRGDAMLVSEDHEGVAGFLQLLDRDDDSVIDLVGVAPRARGRGLGTALVRAAAARRANQPVIVGTQVANHRALAFYEREGFRTIASAYVLHRHGHCGAKGEA